MRYIFTGLWICLFYANLEGDAPKQDEFEFVGYHLLASYLDCDPSRLSDIDGLRDAMQRAAEASGATILKAADYVFPPDGLTMVLLLSESHASIHTYPEHKACFVDFFTCGRHCSSDNFDRALREFLNPQTSNRKLLYRDGSISEINN